jgi:hypothetical protein
VTGRGGGAVQVQERRAGEARVIFASTVRGLVSEAAEVAALFERHAPDCVVLPLGPRELDEVVEVLKEKGKLPGEEGNRAAGKEVAHGPTGLPGRLLAPDEDATEYGDFGLFLSTSDLVFVRHLSKWGAVEMPPPSFQEAVRAGHERGVPVVAADFDDEGYTDLFLARVSAFSLVRQGRRLRKLTKRRFKAASPEALAMIWDARITKIRGYAEVERAREARIAQRVLEAAADRRSVLAIVEFERTAGIIAAFDAGLRSTAAPSPSGNAGAPASEAEAGN